MHAVGVKCGNFLVFFFVAEFAPDECFHRVWYEFLKLFYVLLWIVFQRSGTMSNHNFRFEGYRIFLGGDADCLSGRRLISPKTYGLSRSGRLFLVASSAASRRQFAMAAWLPPSRTSGAFQPLYSEGRV